MILRALSLDGGQREVELHRGLTVVAGLDDSQRAALTAELAGEVMAAPGAAEAGIDVVLRHGDLPEDPAAAVDAAGDAGPRAQERDEEVVTQAAGHEHAAAHELEAARAALDPEARAALAAADTAVAGAEGRLEAARARLARAEDKVRTENERRTELAARHAALGARRAETAAELAAAERANTDAVAEALAAYRRLQSVKRRPSARAAALADRLATYRARQRGELPEVEPPEYLVAPARAALDTAREAVEEAERAGEVPIEVDAAAVEELERAHRRVLEAEQRTDVRPSRLNRRRLEGAQQAERQALVRLGVADYGDYLNRIVPIVRAGRTTRSPDAARAALADAEAVWEELHGGVPPMSDEEVAATLASIREEAVELLGEDPGDDALEDRLRSHLEQVVDVEWARDALATALAGVGVEATGDLEAHAEDWLAGSAARRARVQELEAALAGVDEELAAVTTELDADAARPAQDEPTAQGEQQPNRVEMARAEVEATEAELREAQASRAEAAQRAGQAEGAEQRVAELSARLAEARAAREGAERDAAAAAEAAVNAARLGREAPVELLLYTLARVAAHRAVPRAGALPVVVDDAFTALPEAPRTAVLDLLGRAATAVQVVYLTGSDDIAAWGDTLPPDRALVHRR